MRLRHSEEDYPDDNFVPPELRQQDYTQDVEAPEMIPSGELAGVDAAPDPASPQGPSREELLRKVLEQQQAHDDARAKKISNAAKLDRKRQSEDDLGAMLYAATARKSPQFRNVGESFSKEAAAEGNQGPLSRELALQNLLARYEKKPEDALGTQLKQYQVLKLKKELEAPPKDTSGDFLDESEIAGTEKQMTMAAGMPVKLPRDAQGRVRRSFVGPFNSSSSGMGMMGQKGAIADEGFDLRRLLDAMDRKDKAEAKAAKAAGAHVIFGTEEWAPPQGVEVGDNAINKVRDVAAASSVVDGSLKELRDLFAQAVANPTDQAVRAKIKSRSGILAPKMNQVLGQGAMAAAEFDRVKQSIGDLSSKEFWLGAAESLVDDPKAGAALLGQIDEARKVFRENYVSTARASQYGRIKSVNGKRYRQKPDGKWVEE